MEQKINIEEVDKYWSSHPLDLIRAQQKEIIEAMSARLPVITTDQGAIAEVVEDGLTGLIIKPCVEELVRQICYLLENPEMAKTMGERGRAQVEARFSEQTYFAALTALFREVAETA